MVISSGVSGFFGRLRVRRFPREAASEPGLAFTTVGSATASGPGLASTTADNAGPTGMGVTRGSVSGAEPFTTAPVLVVGATDVSGSCARSWT